MEGMNAELLNLHSILDINNTVPLRASAGAWVRDSLKTAGWEEGQNIPGNLPEYFGAVFSALSLPSRPSSVQAALQRPEVLLTLQSAIKKIQQKANAEAAALEQIPENLRPQEGDSEIQRQIKQQNMEQVMRQIQADTEILEEELEDEDLDEDLEDGSEPDTHVLSGPEGPTHCPCCRWNLAEEYTPPVLPLEEQRAYLVYILGGPAFKKSYPIWGGLCTVTFKTISSQEEELFTELYSKDHLSQKLDIAPIANRKYYQYHTALSLHSISFDPAVGRTAPPVPSIWSSEFEPDKEHTRLEQFLSKWFTKQAVSIELQNELIAYWRQFDQLLNRLQQELYRRDFWTGLTLD